MKKHARQLIISNMVYLLEDYHFDEITIKMLCAESGINRSTFYAHFKDKYDTYDEIQKYHMSNYENLMDNIELSIIEEPANRRKYVKRYFTNVFYYILKYQKFFYSVFVLHPERDFIINFIKLIKTELKNSFLKSVHYKMPTSFLNIQLVDKSRLYIVGYGTDVRTHLKKWQILCIETS